MPHTEEGHPPGDNPQGDHPRGEDPRPHPDDTETPKTTGPYTGTSGHVLEGRDGTGYDGKQQWRQEDKIYDRTYYIPLHTIH